MGRRAEVKGAVRQASRGLGGEPNTSQLTVPLCHSLLFPLPSPFLSPPITQEARGGNERDLHARGRSIWPEAARSCETPAAMMARPCCRGHFITQFSRRGAHSPPPVSSYSTTLQNAEVAPVCPTASNLQPTVTRAADGRELSAGMGCRCSPPPRHITS